MKLYFIRHTSVDVPEGICYGQSNVPLKTSFEDEAEIVKNRLSGIKFDVVFSSPLSRCRKLAEYCGYNNIDWRDRLKEMNFGIWEMTPWENIQEGDNDDMDSWYDKWVSKPVERGESFKMQYDRVASLLDEIIKEDYTNVAIFTHAGVINCARVYTGETSLEKAFDWIPSYGEVVCFDL